MRRLPRFLLVACLISFFSSNVAALTIHIEGVAGEEPAAFTHNPSSVAPLPLALQVHNDSAVTETVGLWQLALEVVSTGGATGTVQIVGYTEPTTKFFSAPISPLAIITPSSQITFQAADIPMPPEPSGTSIVSNEYRDLLAVEVASSDNAQGTFLLVLKPFESPIGGSFWFGQSPAPQLFDAPLNPTHPDQIVLAEITFIPEPCTLVLLSMSVISLTCRRIRKR